MCEEWHEMLLGIAFYEAHYIKGAAVGQWNIHFQMQKAVWMAEAGIR